jgi:hypothetical protein
MSKLAENNPNRMKKITMNCNKRYKAAAKPLQNGPQVGPINVKCLMEAHASDQTYTTTMNTAKRAAAEHVLTMSIACVPASL